MRYPMALIESIIIVPAHLSTESATNHFALNQSLPSKGHQVHPFHLDSERTGMTNYGPLLSLYC